MKFSLLYELQRPPGPEYDSRAIHEAIEQICLADEAGFDIVWTVEHHFLEGFSSSPCNDVFLGAVSQRTKRIRLGLGVVILPFHHPVMVAERVSFLDILSNGRIEFGTGRSGPFEQIGWSVDPRNTREMWEEAMRTIIQLWATDGEFSFEGKYWKLPPRKVLPSPIQKPHPPIWLACAQPETTQLAAERGLGCLYFLPGAPAQGAVHAKAYHETVAKAKPMGAYTVNQYGSLAMAQCGKNNREARDQCAAAARDFLGPNKPYAGATSLLLKNLLDHWGGDYPPHLKTYFEPLVRHLKEHNGQFNPNDAAIQKVAHSYWQQVDTDTLADTGTIVAGDVESCIRGVQQHKAAGSDLVVLNVQNAMTPHERTMKTIELFGEYVIPHFKREEANKANAVKTK